MITALIPDLRGLKEFIFSLWTFAKLPRASSPWILDPLYWSSSSTDDPGEPQLRPPSPGGIVGKGREARSSWRKLPLRPHTANNNDPIVLPAPPSRRGYILTCWAAENKAGSKAENPENGCDRSYKEGRRMEGTLTYGATRQGSRVVETDAEEWLETIMPVAAEKIKELLLWRWRPFSLGRENLQKSSRRN